MKITKDEQLACFKKHDELIDRVLDGTTSIKDAFDEISETTEERLLLELGGFLAYAKTEVPNIRKEVNDNAN